MELVSRYTKREYMYFTRRKATAGYREFTYTLNNSTNNLKNKQPQELVGRYLRARAMWSNPRLTCA